MHDIKIPDSLTDPRADIRSKKSGLEISQVTAAEAAASEPGDKVKVKFENFVQLVATHDFEGVMKKHGNEDLILSTNLLTDLANAHEEETGEGKKLPIIFIVGIIIGVIITYFVIRF